MYIPTLCRVGPEILFGPFDVFCAEVPHLTPKDAARHRIDIVWEGYNEISKQGLLSHPIHDVGQLIGYFCDLHVPLILCEDDPSDLPLNMVYRKKLAPEQNGSFPVIIGGPVETTSVLETQLYALIESLTAPPTPDAAPLCAAGKLLAKGKPRPRSVRYIRPQLMRCCTEPNCSKLAEFILRAHFLETYRHAQTTVCPQRRLEIYSTPLEDLAKSVTHLPSKILYSIISELIAAMLISSIKLLMAAERSWGSLTRYIERALSRCTPSLPSAHNAGGEAHKPSAPIHRFRSLPKTPEDQARLVRAISQEVSENSIVQLPLHPSATEMQREALLKYVGMDDIHAYCCNLCGILHIKSNKIIRKGSKDKVGVTYCIDTGRAICNSCKSELFCHKISMAGSIILTKPTLSATSSSVAVCCKCSLISSPVYTRGVQPYCKACYVSTGENMLEHIYCACGKHWNKKATPRLCHMNGRVIFMGPCHDHAVLFPSTYSDYILRSSDEYKAAISLFK